MKKILLSMIMISCKPAPTTPQRHLGEEYAKKYMTDKYKILENPVCERWEDLGYGKAQSVVCTVGSEIAVYCRAGDGKAPSCELLVDLRKPAPQADVPKALEDKPKK